MLHLQTVVLGFCGSGRKDLGFLTVFFSECGFTTLCFAHDIDEVPFVTRGTAGSLI